MSGNINYNIPISKIEHVLQAKNNTEEKVNLLLQENIQSLVEENVQSPVERNEQWLLRKREEDIRIKVEQNLNYQIPSSEIESWFKGDIIKSSFKLDAEPLLETDDFPEKEEQPQGIKPKKRKRTFSDGDNTKNFE